MKSDTLTTARAERSLRLPVRDDRGDSTPSPHSTAIALRVAALIAYVGALTAAAAPVSAVVSTVTVAVAVPAVAGLLLLAETVAKGGRIR